VTAPDLAEPSTIEEACELLAARPGEAKLIAGGTAVVLMMRQGLILPGLLVSLRNVPGLGAITTSDDRLRIGATATLSAVADSQGVARSTPTLARASGLVGNIRVRNSATVAGNLAEADYAADLPAVLACLNATCHVQGAAGSRTIPAEELITGFYSTALAHDEVITAIDVPVDPSIHSTYLKYVTRSSEDRPCVGVAAAARISDGLVSSLRIVVGAVGPRPVNIDEVCTAAVGRALDDAVVSEIADGYAGEIDPMEDQRGSAWYRREMIRVFVTRAMQELRTSDA
jgi:carbon-monoxide dehydrogenase medium subunit